MWKSIKGYKYQYRINDMGVIEKYEDSKKRWVRLKTFLGSPVERVMLVKENGKRVTMPVHNIMVQAFMGGKPDNMCIIHKNGMKRDTSLYNLKLVSRHECCKLSSHSRRKVVAKIDENGEVLEIYKSMNEAAKKNYLTVSVISNRCLNKVKNPFELTGYSFRYFDNE